MVKRDPASFVDMMERHARWYKRPLFAGAAECPKCHADDGEYCNQCKGWGYVEKGSKDETCIHVWGSAVNVGRCLNNYTCTLCGDVMTVDSSD